MISLILDFLNYWRNTIVHKGFVILSHDINNSHNHWKGSLNMYERNGPDLGETERSAMSQWKDPCPVEYGWGGGLTKITSNPRVIIPLLYCNCEFVIVDITTHTGGWRSLTHHAGGWRRLYDLARLHVWFVSSRHTYTGEGCKSARGQSMHGDRDV